jgi:transposase InsO family protein
VIGTLRREYLDHLIIMNEAHLRAVVREFVGYYNLERPHRSLDLQTPLPSRRPRSGPVRARPVLGGLHRVYERAA